MKVVKLTNEQASDIRGVEYKKDCVFNPTKDADGNWFISVQEIEESEIEWVKSLPLIDYKPKPSTI